MSSEELNLHTKALALKISVITGWQLPESKEYVNILNDQLKKKIVDDYQDLNIDEFEYAMRQATGVKDWGKAINLSLIDEAIVAYKIKRKHISDFENRLTNDKPKVPQLAPPATDYKDLVNIYYQKFLSGKYNMGLWPWEMYHEFEGVYCEAGFWEDHKQRAERRLFSHYTGLRNDARISHNEKEAAECQQKIDALLEPDNIEIEHLAKRLATLFIYETAQKKKLPHFSFKI